MEEFIVIEGKEKYKYTDIKSLVQGFINSNYYNMSEKEKQNELEKKALANTIKKDLKIRRINKEDKEFKDNEFIINNEITYILSMVKFNVIVLLERTDANIFGRYIDIKNTNDNYIIVNKFANDIMKNYISKK